MTKLMNIDEYHDKKDKIKAEGKEYIQNIRQWI